MARQQGELMAQRQRVEDSHAAAAPLIAEYADLHPRASSPVSSSASGPTRSASACCASPGTSPPKSCPPPREVRSLRLGCLPLVRWMRGPGCSRPTPWSRMRRRSSSAVSATWARAVVRVRVRILRSRRRGPLRRSAPPFPQRPVPGRVRCRRCAPIRQRPHSFCTGQGRRSVPGRGCGGSPWLLRAVLLPVSVNRTASRFPPGRSEDNGARRGAFASSTDQRGLGCGAQVWSRLLGPSRSPSVSSLNR